MSHPLSHLTNWFHSTKRDLPWRDDPSPYEVWVSEVMLQQTQVAVVVPYFLRWMQLFPTIEKLASAQVDEVIKAWEGLGYYSRARNLHEGAKYVMHHHQGILPDSYEELSKIKGLGPYTIGAIQSFAYHKKVAAVDGNVVRVLTRYLGISDDISKPKTMERLRQEASQLLPDHEPWVVNEALIELGATVCQKQPKCGSCPLKKECIAHNKGMTNQLPYKSAKIKYEKLQRTVAVVCHGDNLLVRRGEQGEIMNDLHEFPYFEEHLDEKQLQKQIKKSLKLDVTAASSMKEVAQSFTRFRVQLKPYFCQAKEQVDVAGFRWHSRDELEKLAFSSGHRRIWSELASANFKYL